MPPSNFDAQLERSRRDAEEPIKRWLQKSSAFILPAYNFSGDGAPKLEAFSDSDSLTLPDLLAARAGVMFWVEVKLKTMATKTYSLGDRLDTGLALRHWRDYLTVRDKTGCKLFLVFAHEKENIVTFDESIRLDTLSSRRIDDTVKMDRGGMIFWALEDLTVVASLSDVREGRRPAVSSEVCVALVGQPDARRICGRPALPKGLRHDPDWPLCAFCERARRGVAERWRGRG